MLNFRFGYADKVATRIVVPVQLQIQLAEYEAVAIEFIRQYSVNNIASPAEQTTPLEKWYAALAQNHNRENPLHLAGWDNNSHNGLFLLGCLLPASYSL